MEAQVDQTTAAIAAITANSRKMRQLQHTGLGLKALGTRLLVLSAFFLRSGHRVAC